MCDAFPLFTLPVHVRSQMSACPSRAQLFSTTKVMSTISSLVIMMPLAQAHTQIDVKTDAAHLRDLLHIGSTPLGISWE